MRRIAFAVSGFALLAALAACDAKAGVVVTTENSGGPNEAPGRTTAMYLEADKIKMNAGRGEMIFRGDLSKIWMLDPANKAFREMNPETMRAMKAQMAVAVAQMQKGLEKMPPAQRKQAEAAMAERGIPPAGTMAAQAPEISYERVGGAKTIGTWSCQPYKMSINGKFEAEQCVAKLGEVGLSRDDFKGFVKLTAFMSDLTGTGAQPAGAFDFDAMSKAIGFDGVPVQTTHYDPDGHVDFQTTMKTVEHQVIPASIFEVPTDFRKLDVPLTRPPAGIAQ